MRSESKQIADITRASRHYRIEPASELADQSLEPLANNLGLGQRELTDRRRQERDSLLTRFHHRQSHPRIDQLERNPGDTSSRPCVEDIASIRRKYAPEEETIEEDSLDDPHRFRGSEQAMHGLPFSQ